MKITAFVGSARKKHSYNAVKKFLETISQREEIDYEIVNLYDYRLEICRGCKLCTDKGEELCPLKDDRDKLTGKMRESDGVVFVSPNYTFQVSGMMKVFLDRLACFCHRPEFFGKTFTSIVPQGIFGGGKIVKYLDFIAAPMGFKVVKGSCITTLEPMTQKDLNKIDVTIGKHAGRFLRELKKTKHPAPSAFDVMMFRMSRTKIRLMQNETFRDYNYYKEQGWFESDFFYPVRLGLLLKIFGRLIDRIISRSSIRPA